MREILGRLTHNTDFVDTHMHTIRSDGTRAPAEIVDFAEASGRLRMLYITDHETIAPAGEAYDYCERAGYRLKVGVGAELTTRDGHVVALDISQDIPTGKTVEWTVRQIHNQGGLAIAAHPLYVGWTRSLSERTLLRIINDPDPEIYFDGFEVFNAGVGDNHFSKVNAKALAFYLTVKERQPELAWKLGAPIGCTDGHHSTVGRGLTGYQGDFRQAIRERNTAVFSLDEKEQLVLGAIARQFYGSMVLEPGRRIHRYAMRRLQEGNGGK